MNMKVSVDLFSFLILNRMFGSPFINNYVQEINLTKCEKLRLV